MRPLGIPAGILRLAYAHRIEVCVSADLFAEYQEVLRRPRLKIPDVAARQLLDWCKDHAKWVDGRPVLGACSDPDDNMVLACAQESDADFLVTGNVVDFPREWRKLGSSRLASSLRRSRPWIDESPASSREINART